jgi:hypothetical protein
MTKSAYPQWKQDLLRQIRDYANDHYNEGWDVVVEACDDEEICIIIGKAFSLKGALARIQLTIDARAEALSNCY